MKITLTSEQLKELGIDIVEFINEGPHDAIWTYAQAVGDRKGWGSEGVGVLHGDTMQDFGFYADNGELIETWDDIEEGDEVTLDGVDVREYDVKVLEAEQLLKKSAQLHERLKVIGGRLNELYPRLTQPEIRGEIQRAKQLS